MEDINLHFTGDFHAIAAAHNLLCAMLDNHLHQGNALQIDNRLIPLKRVVDMNDRALRTSDSRHPVERAAEARAGGVTKRHAWTLVEAIRHLLTLVLTVQPSIWTTGVLARTWTVCVRCV